VEVELNVVLLGKHHLKLCNLLQEFVDIFSSSVLHRRYDLNFLSTAVLFILEVLTWSIWSDVLEILLNYIKWRRNIHNRCKTTSACWSHKQCSVIPKYKQKVVLWKCKRWLLVCLFSFFHHWFMAFHIELWLSVNKRSSVLWPVAHKAN
jgi:hypothetical protein